MHAPAPDASPIPRAFPERAERWRSASFDEQADALERSVEATAQQAGAWVRAGHHAKGLPVEHGEEWFAGPIPVLRGLRLWARSLRRLARSEPLVDRDRCRLRADGRVVVRAFPNDAIDAALFRGVEAEARMAPGTTIEQVREEAGRRARARGSGCCAILGAGNVSAIPPLDALSKCVNEQTPSVVKLSPVNAWVRPFLERGLAPLIELGGLAFVEGDADLGAQLVADPSITSIHLTGSAATHDRLVWGTDDRAARPPRPILDKPITSELGNVSPVAVVPGNYTDAELDHVTGEVVAMLTHNASFNCAAAKVLVLAEGWHQKEALVRRIQTALRRVPTRPAYYPGARERFEALVGGRSQVDRFGRETADRLPWTLLRGLDPAATDEPLFDTEAFCPVLGVVELDVPGALGFIRDATQFMNTRLWGTLAATWFVCQEQAKLPPVSAELDRATDELRYGVVGFNIWPAIAFGLVSPPWGGHPSATATDIQSGRGFVHGTDLLEGVEKTVLRGPMPAPFKPVWSADHRQAAEVGRKLARMERAPSWLKVPPLAFSALLG